MKQHYKRLVDTSTLEGIYNDVLLRTGDKEAAEKARTEAHVQMKIDHIKATER